MAVSSKKTSPKPRQISQSSTIDDNFLSSANIKNLENELNYIRSIIKHLKGTDNYDTLSVYNIESLADGVIGATGYTHTQTVASSIWTITHALNKTPNVIIFDNDLNQIFAEVKALNVNTTRITFSEPLTGTAFLN